MTVALRNWSAGARSRDCTRGSLRRGTVAWKWASHGSIVHFCGRVRAPRQPLLVTHDEQDQEQRTMLALAGSLRAKMSSSGTTRCLTPSSSANRV